MRTAFHASPRPTLGVEEEYQICDPASGDLVPRVDDLMAHADDDFRGYLSHDLIEGLIEVNTDVAESVDEAILDLADKRRRVQALAEAEGCTLGMTGAHPYADPKRTTFVDTESYRWVRSQLRYVAARNITFGLHVHVGVDDAERAIYVANALRRWIGALIAVAANSPFLDDVDTGWDSARSFAFGTFPRSNVPPHLTSWRHYEEVMELLLRAGSIEKPRHVWWNVRAHPEYGTVELRACDLQMSLARTAAVVALSQALVVAYAERHRRGAEAEPLERSFIEDCRFKGMRFGLGADVVDPATRRVMSMSDHVREMVAVAREATPALGTDEHVDRIEGILDEGNEATAQRRLAEAVDGDLRRLQRNLIDMAREMIARPDLAGVEAS